MYATDFTFDGRKLSNYGLMIGEISGSSSSTTTTGGVTVKNVSVPGKDSFEIYASTYDGSIVWEIGLIKYDCSDINNHYISQTEDAVIRRWLIRKDGYHWIHFDQDEFEDIFYKVYINLSPIYINGRLVGYHATITSNCEYGFSKEHVYDFFLNWNDSFEIVNISDEHGYIYPTYTITSLSSGNLIFQNLCEEDQNRYTQLYDIKNNQIVHIDSENEMIEGISYDKWNWKFPRMVQDVYGYKSNKFTSNLPCTVNMKIRYPRKAVI